MDFLKLTEDCLSVDEVLKLVSSEKCGAVSMFIGTTRDNFEGKTVKNLEYEAYEPMANKVMKNLCSTIRNKWKDVVNIAIHHRLGTVPVMEASVVIAISSPHRVDSIAAVQYCIENLKALKPIESLVDSKVDVDSNLIQLNASHDEITNRIKKYTDRKRAQININNIKDFTTHKKINQKDTDYEESTCARIDAVIMKLDDSKGHLKVKHTKNEWGPQTSLSTSNISTNEKIKSTNPMFGVEERVSNIEEKINISKPVSRDIYSRLKVIEDKIMELESISPEYSTFWTKRPLSLDMDDSKKPLKKKTKYSSEEIWSKIKTMEEF